MFSLPIDLTKCHEDIIDALQEFCNRWCKRQHVKTNVLNTLKLNISNIIDKTISLFAII